MRKKVICLCLAYMVSCFYINPVYGSSFSVDLLPSGERIIREDSDKETGQVEDIDIKEEMARTDLQVDFFCGIPELMVMEEDTHEEPPDDVLSLMVPESMDFYIDVYNTSGLGQIISRNYIFENYSTCDVNVSIDSISYTFANDTDFVSVTELDELNDISAKKEIYLYLEDVTDVIDMETGLVAVTTPSEASRVSTPSEAVQISTQSEAAKKTRPKASPSQAESVEETEAITSIEQETGTEDLDSVDPKEQDEETRESIDMETEEQTSAFQEDVETDQTETKEEGGASEPSSQDIETKPSVQEEVKKEPDETEPSQEDNTESEQTEQESEAIIAKKDVGGLLKAAKVKFLEEDMEGDINEENNIKEKREGLRETDRELSENLVLSNKALDDAFSFTLSSANDSTENKRVFRLNGAVSQYAEREWQDGDVKVNVIFTVTPILEEEELPLESLEAELEIDPSKIPGESQSSGGLEDDGDIITDKGQGGGGSGGGSVENNSGTDGNDSGVVPGGSGNETSGDSGSIEGKEDGNNGPGEGQMGSGTGSNSGDSTDASGGGTASGPNGGNAGDSGNSPGGSDLSGGDNGGPSGGSDSGEGSSGDSSGGSGSGGGSSGDSSGGSGSGGENSGDSSGGSGSGGGSSGDSSGGSGSGGAL